MAKILSIDTCILHKNTNFVNIEYQVYVTCWSCSAGDTKHDEGPLSASRRSNRDPILKKEPFPKKTRFSLLGKAGAANAREHGG